MEKEKKRISSKRKQKQSQTQGASNFSPFYIKPYVPPIPFSQRLKKKNLGEKFSKFLEVFKKLHMNIPFANALKEMPS